MIDLLNEEINKFLLSYPNIADEKLNEIQKKYSSSITDNLDKGHVTTNICMIAASNLKQNPKDIATALVEWLKKKKFEKVESAGPGFVNITLQRSDFVSIINNINQKSQKFGESDYGNNKSVQIEFVSANPTGPLHVGHGRGAAYGDAIGRILSSSGYKVEKEYYINDAGRQIDILTASVFARIYEDDFNGFFPKSAYKGTYVSEIALAFKDKNNYKLDVDKSLIENLPGDEEKEIDELILRIKNNYEKWADIKAFALDEVLNGIKTDLKSFNVTYDKWYSESSLGDIGDNESKIKKAIDSLIKTKLAYKDNGAIWLDTSRSGDDKNRVLIRDDGRATYFASDVAYHKDKIDRGFDKLINVWGADHHGYIKRIEASIEGLGFDKEKLDVQLVQFANLFKDGKKVKMSTRSGDFYSLADLINEIGTDAARFYYLSKQADQHLDFDLNLAKADSKENIFYYIQYAHARICSLIEKYNKNYGSMPKDATAIISSSYINCDKLIHEMSKYPHIVLRAAIALQPHLIIYYLKDFAQSFHSFYNDNKVLTESKENTDSIVYCLNAAKIIIANGLKLLGIEPIEKNVNGMKDYANRNKSRKRNITRKKTVFRSKKNNSPLISNKIISGIILLAITLGAISFLYFDTDVATIKSRESSNNIKIDFPTSLAKNSVLIETELDESFLSCEYFVQIGAYGNKKYAYEAKEILSEVELITINEIYSNSKPGKLLHSVITGPYENRSAANNIKEKITNIGFDPQLRTLCKKELEANINSLNFRISKAGKTVSKNLNDIFLIAVSKKKSIEHITKAKELGIKNFGENYAQELENKAINFDKDVNWHFIGPLQSNKAKIIAKHADWIHTIDRKKIAEKINDECKKINKIINACIQVNISNESTKAGINPENLLVFAKYVDSMENINLKGIMVLPSLGENNKKQMQDSKLLHEELVSVFPHAEFLSMGTTNDFETAIVSGSNMIRVGELILAKGNEKIVFYGSGNISQALISGLISSGYKKSFIEFIDRNKINSRKTKKLGATKTNLKAIDSKSIIFLGVKPKDAMSAYIEICSVIKKPKIVSLVAGIKSNKYLSQYKDVELIRAMTNTSSQFNKGITAIYNCSANKTAFNQVSSIFKKLGTTIDITKENKIDDFTGLIGSGPAYFFYLLKVYEKRILKLCDGDKSKKDNIICNLLEGVSHSINDNSNLDELIASVASKKGTTEAGLKSFKSSKLSQNFEKGIAAAIKRAKDISVEF